jgi:fucose permease
LLIIGAGLGLALPAANTDGLSRVPPNRHGQAFGMMGSFRQLGGAMGIAVIGTLISARELAQLPPIAARYAQTSAEQAELEQVFLGAAQGQEAATQTLRERWPAAIDDLRLSGAHAIADGFYLATALLAVALVLAVVLLRPAPTSAEQLPPRKRQSITGIGLGITDVPGGE